MKKFLAILLAAAMMMCFTACGFGRVMDAIDEIQDGNTVSQSIFDDFDDAEPDAEFSLGSNDGSVYRNEFLGIGFNLPEGWTFYTDEQIRELNNIATDALEGDIAEQLENSSVIYDMQASDQGGSNVNVNLEKMSLSNSIIHDAESYVSESIGGIEEALKQLGFSEVISEITTTYFAGEERTAIEIVCTGEGIELYEKVVVMEVGRYIACVTAATVNENNADDILSNFYSLDAAPEYDLSDDIIDIIDDVVTENSSEAAFSLGSNDGSTYTNEFVGIGFDLPEGWTFHTDEQIRELNNISTDIPDEDAAKQLESTSVVYDMKASDSSGNNIGINMEKIGAVYANIMDEEDYLSSTIDQLDETMMQLGFSEVNSELTTSIFAGKKRPAIAIECLSDEVDLYEKLVCIEVGEYMVNITVATVNEDNTDSILALFYSLG